MRFARGAAAAAATAIMQVWHKPLETGLFEAAELDFAALAAAQAGVTVLQPQGKRGCAAPMTALREIGPGCACFGKGCLIRVSGR